MKRSSGIFDMRIACLLGVGLCLLLGTGCVGPSSDTVIPGSYAPEWESLQAHQIPEWLMDAKFGIHFHWGIYSVPASYDESYSRNMYISHSVVYHHHLESYGSPTKFGYKNFITYFKAQNFDPDEWAALFVESGARFAGPVAEHADGFSMWDSDVSTWNAANMGPHRDVVGELEQAIRNRGMRFLISLHHHRRWGWFPTYKTDMDTSDPMYEGLYGPVLPSDAYKFSNPDPPPSPAFQEQWLTKATEVIDRYHPDVLMFGERMSIVGEQYRKEMVYHYYQSALEEDRDVVLSHHNEDLPQGAGVPVSEWSVFNNTSHEYGRRRSYLDIEGFHIVTNSIDHASNSYRWNASYESTEDIIDKLVSAVTRNGVYILNITPRADGVIPDAIRVRLQKVGAWLAENGEAIYETRPWEVYGEVPRINIYSSQHVNMVKSPMLKTIRFTQSKDGRFLYVFFPEWPGETAVIGSLSSNAEHHGIDSIVQLGTNQPLSWTQDDQGLHIRMPDQDPSRYVEVVKVTWQQ